MTCGIAWSASAGFVTLETSEMNLRHLGFYGLFSVGALALASSCGDDKSSGSTSTSGTSGACAPEASCPANAVKSDCVALVDNSGKDQFALRLSQLSVTAPAAL